MSYSSLINGATFAGPDQGLDFTGKGTVKALGNGEITRLLRSGSGWPGEGALLVYKLTSGPASGRYVYVAEDFQPLGSLTVGTKIKAGQALGTATGSGKAPGIEAGFAQNSLGQAYGTPQEGHGLPADPEAGTFKQLVEGESSGSSSGTGVLGGLGQAFNLFGVGPGIEVATSSTGDAIRKAVGVPSAGELAGDVAGQLFAWVKEAFGDAITRMLLYALLAGGGLALILSGLTRAAGIHQPARKAAHAAMKAAEIAAP